MQTVILWGCKNRHNLSKITVIGLETHWHEKEKNDYCRLGLSLLPRVMNRQFVDDCRRNVAFDNVFSSTRSLKLVETEFRRDVEL
jgi:hypothetical protein